MALTASRITVGFEPVRNLLLEAVPNPNKWRLTPNTAFKRGDMVVLTDGMVALASATSTQNILGVMAASYSATDNPSAKTTYGLVYDHPFNVYRCTFVDHRDASATGGDTTTIIDTGLATSANDVWNGALVYVYEGPGAGSVRTVADYVGAEDKLVVLDPFPAVITNKSKYILLGKAAETGDVINKGKAGLALKDEKSIDADAAVESTDTEVGPLTCLEIYPADLMMDVVISLGRCYLG